MNIVNIKIEELKFADYNPRQISEKQVEELKKSIENFGVVEPIVVNENPDRKNIIVGGHQRVRILQMLGHTEVPVFYVNLDEIREKELNIRLNKNTGNWDWEKLGNVFDVDSLLEWGFTEGELGLGDAKDEVDTDNLGASLDSYLDGNIRQVVLYFKKDEYEDVLKRLETVMEEQGVDSHSLAFLKLLEYYESSRTEK